MTPSRIIVQYLAMNYVELPRSMLALPAAADFAAINKRAVPAATGIKAGMFLLYPPAPALLLPPPPSSRSILEPTVILAVPRVVLWSTMDVSGREDRAITPFDWYVASLLAHRR
jgi:hypothetical protein